METSDEVDYRSITSVQALQDISTHDMFHDAVHQEGSRSPIDAFIVNTNEINRLYLAYLDPTRGDMPAPLGALVVLGYMSAVESYFRSITRNIINIDEFSRRKAEPLMVQFGAAMFHTSEMLPEALLENYTFSGRRGITEAFKDLLGITQIPPEVSLALDRFSRVCEIRHCCVHRFGRLGSRNAIKLGLTAHSAFLERPFSPSVDDLQSIADLLRTFAKTINNFLFSAVLKRSAGRAGSGSADYPWEWSWRWQQDRRRFLRFYSLFASTLDSPPSPPARASYDSFKAHVREGA